MRRQGLGILVGATIAFAATPALAQDKKFDVNIGGGFTATTGEVHNHLGNGGNFMIGVTFHVNEHLGIQAEYGYSPIGSKTVDLPTVNPLGTTPVDAGHHMHQGTFNVISRFGASDATIRPYAIGGVGVYNRVVQLTSPGTGLVTVCDPWWYVCYPVAVPVTNILGERSSTDFGINVGGGFNFRLGDHVHAYFEARYHYIWGPKASSFVQGGVLPPGFVDKNANGQYFPVTFGIRF
jgi:opacity protein-like surface antigen